MRAFKLLCGTAALALLIAPGARADEWNKKTFLTFSGPVQVPGVTLPAGTYMFELADPDATRHVVRVSSQDGAKNYAMFITVPADRLEPPDNNVVMFAERSAGLPQAIQMWFYPGDRIGEEFVYPKSQAVQIAKATHKGVLSTADNKLSDTSAAKSASVARVDESGRTSNTDRDRAAASAAPSTTAPSTTTATTAAPANTVNGSRQPSTGSTYAQANTATPGSSVGTSGKTPKRSRLPQTASDLTAFELLSGLAFAAAFGARLIRRRAAEV
jgi:hypothetical protein